MGDVIRHLAVLMIVSGVMCLSPVAVWAVTGDEATHEADHALDADIIELPEVHVHGLPLNKDQQVGPVPKATPWPAIPSSLDGKPLDDWMKARLLVSKGPRSRWWYWSRRNIAAHRRRHHRLEQMDVSASTQRRRPRRRRTDRTDSLPIAVETYRHASRKDSLRDEHPLLWSTASVGFEPLWYGMVKRCRTKVAGPRVRLRVIPTG